MRLIGLVLTLCLALAPLGAEAQQKDKIARIGYLATDGAASDALQDAFLHGLRALACVEGENVGIESRSADSRTGRLPDLASELVRLEVDVIVTSDTSAALGAKQVTATIPIVMASSSAPVFYGLVASLARPSGNVTGLHSKAPPEPARKRLQLLREVVPRLARVGVAFGYGAT